MATPPAADTPPLAADSAPLESFGYTQELRRELRFTDLLAYGLVFMVPIAPFAIFGGVFQASGGMVALTYAVAMVAMMFTAASYAQMVRAFPMAGSVYSYAGRGIAPPLGFLAGWAILLDYVLVPCLLYVVAAVSMNAIVPTIPVVVWLIAFVVVNTVINYLGIRLTAQVTRWFLYAELAVLALVLVVGLIGLAQGRGSGFSFDPIFDSGTFSFSLIFGGVAVAVLSFLGFDGISMLAEENREEARQVGRAMVGALLVAGVLFITQTWLGSLFVADPDGLITNGDPNGTAFNQAAERMAGGHWLYVVTAGATAIAWGFANAMVAQAATSRLLFAMARDRQLPAFLAKVSPRHSAPVNAVLLVGGISLALGLTLWLTRDDAITLLVSLVNFGAMIAFLTLHVSVVWHYVVRNGSRDYLRHLVLPVVGFVILLFVVLNLRVYSQVVGGIWLLIGVLVLVGLYAAKRRPTLSGLAPDAPVPPDDDLTVPTQRGEPV